MVRFQLTKNCIAALLKKMWVVFMVVVNWNPAFLSLKQCKDLYVEFLYTSCEGQIIWMLLVNGVYKVVLLAGYILMNGVGIKEHIAFGCLAIFVQIGLIALKMCSKKNFFKKINYAVFFIEFVLLLLFEFQLNTKSMELDLLFSLTFLLNITASLQNSTFLTVFFIIAMYIENIVSFTTNNYPIARYEEVRNVT